MSDTSNKDTNFHHEVHSEPHTGHESTAYEGTDASVKLVLGSLAAIGLTLLITALLTFPIQNILKTANPEGHLPSPLSPERVIPSGPLIEVHPWETFPTLRAHEESILLHDGASPNGQQHLAIDEAIGEVVSKLKIRPGASEGYTVPGGQGRDFAGSLQSMPTAYQATISQATAPQGAVIQGEIHKPASKRSNPGASKK